MPNLFEKIFDKWLWQKDKTFNPFLKTLAEGMKKNPEVPSPKRYKYNPHQEDFKEEI